MRRGGGGGVAGIRILLEVKWKLGFRSLRWVLAGRFSGCGHRSDRRHHRILPGTFNALSCPDCAGIVNRPRPTRDTRASAFSARISPRFRAGDRRRHRLDLSLAGLFCTAIAVTTHACLAGMIVALDASGRFPTTNAGAREMARLAPDGSS